MSQPIRLEFPPRDAGAELQTRLQNAPLQYAEALLSGDDLLQRLHDRGVLDLLRGGLGSSDNVISIAVEAATTPDANISNLNRLYLSIVVCKPLPESLDHNAPPTPYGLSQQ